MESNTERKVIVRLTYGERGPIVVGAHSNGQRYEITQVEYEVSEFSDGEKLESVRALGLPVRKDGERKASATYTWPVYGDEALAVAAEWLKGKIADV